MKPRLRTTVARYGHAAGLFLTPRAHVKVDVRTSTISTLHVRTCSEQVAQLSQRDRVAGGGVALAKI